MPEEQLAAIATVPFLDVLPLQQKEALAAALERIERPGGRDRCSPPATPATASTSSRQGTIEIDLPTGPKVEDAPAFVGEIALLRDVPRTATRPRRRRLDVLDARRASTSSTPSAGTAAAGAAADALVASRGIALSA